MNEHLDDLILLAERGMGWTREEWSNQVGPGDFIVLPYGRLCYFVQGREIMPLWNPFTSIADASMLMRKLGIDLTHSYLRGHMTGWTARKGSAAGNQFEAWASGNTELAMCEAVCACALEILRKR